MDQRRSAPSLFAWGLALACAVLALLVVALARRTASLEAEVERLRAESAPAAPGPGALGAGDALREVGVLGPDGSVETLALAGDRPTLLLVVSEGCPTCELAPELWTGLLADDGFPLGVRAIAVTLDPSGAGAPPAFVQGTERAVVAHSPPGSAWRRIAMTPMTALVDPEGVVTRVWYGLPDGAALHEIADAARAAAAE